MVAAHPTFVARCQQHATARITTALDFSSGEGEMAGLAALQNDDFFVTIARTRTHGRDVIRVSRRSGKQDPRNGVTLAERPVTPGPVRFRIAAHDGRYDLTYSRGA